jgi:hypothetical protein
VLDRGGAEATGCALRLVQARKAKLLMGMVNTTWRDDGE